MDLLLLVDLLQILVSLIEKEGLFLLNFADVLTELLHLLRELALLEFFLVCQSEGLGCVLGLHTIGFCSLLDLLLLLEEHLLLVQQ